MSMELPNPIGAATRPFTLVIFGASGDLTRRKLVPALFGLHRERALPADYQIIGFARREKSDASFRQEMLEGVQSFSRFAPVSTAEWEDFASHISYHCGNFDEPAAHQALRTTLEQLCQTRGLTQHLFYLATAPEFFSPIVQSLHQVHLVGHDCAGRVVIEKPFGHDYNSARQLVGALNQCVDESALYRIDHYLGKETVQNLLYFRFANSIFEPVWQRSMIDHVQITVAEREGVGTRGGYYDHVGALRDMVQNHLMQLLTITAMEPPASLHSEALRDEKVKVLRSIPTPTVEIVRETCIRAQYDGYRSAERVRADSTTETYVAAKLMIDNWRWAGIPFYLRTGKGLATRASEIVVVFKQPPMSLFTVADRAHFHRNRLHIRLQPEEGIHLMFNTKLPGKRDMGTVDMDFAYRSKFGSYSPEAYERLLHDFIVGDSTLFTRGDEVLEAWRIADAISTGWQEAPVARYAEGSWGPQEADTLIQSHTRSGWVPINTRIS